MKRAFFSEEEITSAELWFFCDRVRCCFISHDATPMRWAFVETRRKESNLNKYADFNGTIIERGSLEMHKWWHFSILARLTQRDVMNPIVVINPSAFNGTKHYSFQSRLEISQVPQYASFQTLSEMTNINRTHTQSSALSRVICWHSTSRI